MAASDFVEDGSGNTAIDKQMFPVRYYYSQRFIAPQYGGTETTSIVDLTEIDSPGRLEATSKDLLRTAATNRSKNVGNPQEKVHPDWYNRDKIYKPSVLTGKIGVQTMGT